MDAQVACQPRQLCEALVAVGAREGPRAIVGQLVAAEDLWLGEGLATHWAGVRPFAAMNLLMLLQQPPVSEALAALFAREGSFPGVLHLVPPHV